MLADFGYAIADADFYAPLCRATDPGHRFMPSAVPAGWTAGDYDLWTLRFCQ